MAAHRPVTQQSSAIIAGRPEALLRFAEAAPDCHLTAASIVSAQSWVPGQHV
jgi:hypothetical protein